MRTVVNVYLYTCVYMCILLLPASLFPTVYLTYLFMPCQFLKAKIFKESLAGPSFRAEHDLLGDVSIDLNQERSCVDLSTSSHLSTKPALFILLDFSRSFLVGMQFDSFILYLLDAIRTFAVIQSFVYLELNAAWEARSSSTSPARTSTGFWRKSAANRRMLSGQVAVNITVWRSFHMSSRCHFNL